MPLPAADRMSITSAWLESIVYGISCMLFSVCMHVLFNRGKRAHWVIPVSCFFHFSIATAHNICCLFRSLQAFTNPAIISVPNGSILYLLRPTTLALTMAALYIMNTFALNLLLIWRLYVVWNHNRILAIIMLILEAGRISTAVAAWAVVLRFRQVFSHTVFALSKTSFALDFVFTVSVTSGIAYRLWRAGKDVSHLTDHNAYKAVIYAFIECGAIYTSSILVLSALSMSGSLAGVMAIDVNVQIATLTPLLLLVSVSRSLTKSDLHFDIPATTGLVFVRPVQVNMTEGICTHPVETMDSSLRKTHSMRSYHDNVA
ncbi:hypothetical protein DEU56DRAFT_825489 [Suillus clintonianus]|uniref:uncharacterized protein n=1 Tax=Suillus clintonianus TaxID=1904413 RepID=UPI001B86F9E1|nr:uncharacterized protein DEU56DRAFT_825489 [Suillus clintonianus]KAG2125409.1 hypothetical protein DEU56DRAFT_825489 [Suillus clintonianus]